MHHDASVPAPGVTTSACCLKTAFAALTATMSAALEPRITSKTLPWDDKGSRLLTVANYERYTELMDGLARAHGPRARPLHRGLRRQHRPGPARPRQALPHRGLSLQGGAAGQVRPSATASSPVPDADHFMAQLASDDTDRVKRDIESQIEERLHDAVGDLYRRLGEAVERVSERLREDDDGKPLVFRDSMIGTSATWWTWCPGSTSSATTTLARLCEQVKDKIAGVEPDALRPSKTFDPAARARVKRDADALAEKFAGYFGEPGMTARPSPEREAA